MKKIKEADMCGRDSTWGDHEQEHQAMRQLLCSHLNTYHQHDNLMAVVTALKLLCFIVIASDGRIFYTYTQ